MPNIQEIVSRPGSERAILSAILNDNDKIIECEQANLSAQHFSIRGHQILYSVIAHLYTRQDIHEIDSTIIYNSIQDVNAKESVDELGGMLYIDALFQSRNMNNISFYISQIKTCAIRRGAYDLGQSIQDTVVASRPDEPVDDMMFNIQQQVLDLVLQGEPEEDIYKMGSKAFETLMERANNPNRIPGYSMGWERYDSVTQGHKPNDLTVVVGKSKSGKSTFLLNHAYKFAVIDDLPVLYIDTEMNSREQEDRLLAIDTGIPYEEIVNGMFARDTEFGRGADKIEKLRLASERLKDAPLYHVFMPDFTIQKATSYIRKYHLQHNLACVIFDYIKLPSSEASSRDTAQEYQKLGYFTTALKDIAGTCNIPVITAAQANRTGSGDGDESDVGGSYRIIQMASRVIFLKRKTPEQILMEGTENGNLKVKIGFQRNGGTSGDIDFLFDLPTLRMKEIQS